MTKAACSHLPDGQDWLKPLVEAHMRRKRGEGDALICIICLSSLSEQDLCRGKCSAGHSIALNVGQCKVYCLACRTAVVPPDFQLVKQAVGAASRLTQQQYESAGQPPNDPAPQVLAKRRRLNASADVAAAQRNHHVNNVIGKELQGSNQAFTTMSPKDGLPVGLRGLNNLGNTCFMNSVLQALLHTPLVRSYYLGDGHVPVLCKHKSSKPCLGCEMDALFNAMYSGERQPFSPVDFLYSWWCQADKLAEYQQQDAHEFYLSALSALSPALLNPPTVNNNKTDANMYQTTAEPTMAKQQQQQQQHYHHFPSLSQQQQYLPGGSDPYLSSQGHAQSQTAGHTSVSMSDRGAIGECDLSEDSSQPAIIPSTSGLVEAVFGGLLRSDVSCSVCGHTSTAYDPFLDISLEIQPPQSAPSKNPVTAQQPQPTQQPRPSKRVSNSNGTGVGWPTTLSTATNDAASSMDNVSGDIGPSVSGQPQDNTQGVHDKRAPLGKSGGLPRGLDMVLESHAEGESLSMPHCLDEGLDEGSEPAGRSESCSLETAPRLSHRLSESSVQDDGLPKQATPEISDVSSLLAVTHPEVNGKRKTRKSNSVGQTGRARVDNPNGQGHNGNTVKKLANVEASNRSQQCARAPETSTELGESQLDGSLDFKTAGAGLPAWESPLDDSMSSPLHLRPGQLWFTQQQRDQQASLQDNGVSPKDDATPASRGAPSRHMKGESGQVSLSEVMHRLQQEEDVSVIANNHSLGTGPANKPPPSNKSEGKRSSKTGGGRNAQAASTRCGECHTCLNRHLKKSCLRSRANATAAQAVKQGNGSLAAGHDDTTSNQAGRIKREGQQQACFRAAGNDSQPVCDVNQSDASDSKADGKPYQRSHLTPEPTTSTCKGDEPEGSMLDEPACSHLALQTVAWPTGQGQHAIPATDSKQTPTTAENDEQEGPAVQSNRRPQDRQSSHDAATGVSLVASLKQFIQAEALHSSEAWTCSHCKRQQHAIKQMSIRHLPPVLCLHVKRFEQALGSARVIRKLQERLSFPIDHLDMSPFVTATLLKQRYAVPMTEGAQRDFDEPAEADDVQSSDDASELGYFLFAVIVHKGDITGGHYVVYVRCCGTWFCCDDAWVTMVSVDEVQQAQAYMLFYTQKKFATDPGLSLVM